MSIINASIQINATKQKVWSIISNLDAEPQYWKGTKKVQTLSQDGNKIIRKVVLAFRDAECMQEIRLQPMNQIDVTFTTGVVKGTKIMYLEEKNSVTTLKVVWDINMTGILKMFTGMVKNHIKKGTTHALDGIKIKAEE
ncbi:MAG: SRPBCC family protein [Candidatus Nitrosoabyssus spongiisocia]|nr:MAG: SRPBCC family protein [Nitrosopumilaceae archaeon AB1(1)]